MKRLLGKFMDRARQAAGDESGRVTTVEQRATRAQWGGALCQLGHLLASIGASMIESAHEDAETAAGAAHDTGYEQHRADVAAQHLDDPYTGCYPPGPDPAAAAVPEPAAAGDDQATRAEG
jgi:hypothetical protein